MSQALILTPDEVYDTVLAKLPDDVHWTWPALTAATGIPPLALQRAGRQLAADGWCELTTSGIRL